MSLTFRHRLTWSDVDYARVAYYARYSVWVDEAFHNYLFEQGFHTRGFIEQGFGLPYISTSCRYFRPLTIEDEVELQCRITELKPKGFTLAYRIVKAGDTEAAAEGEMVRRCIQAGPPVKSVEMPPVLRQILETIISP